MNKTNIRGFKVCGLVIDAFTGTVTVRKENRKRATEKALELFKSGILYDYYENGRRKNKEINGEYKGHMYQHNYKVKGFENPCAVVVLQISPLNKSKKNKQNFIRFEFKGNKLSGADITKLIRMIRDVACLDYTDSILKLLKVNRVDFAINIYGMHITNFLFRGHRYRNSKMVYNEGTGVLETVYIGNAGRRACIYNSPAEQHKDTEYTLTKKDDMTRIEVRLFPYCRFKDLRKKIEGLFSFIKIYSNDLDADDFSSEFLELVISKGLQKAFSEAANEEKLTLESYRVRLYNNRKMEKEAAKIARELGLIFKSAHKSRRKVIKRVITDGRK